MAHRPQLADRPDQTAVEITRFGLSLLQASGALFYWIDDGQKMSDVSLEGMSTRFYLDYAMRMEETDPSNVSRMTSARDSVTQLRQPNRPMPAETALYHQFLHDYGVTDVIDLMFWSEGVAVAGIGILKRHSDPPTSQAAITTACVMQRYIEFNLQKHERLSRARCRRILTQTYGLTTREITVAELIIQGLTNNEIAESLNMKLPTVKSHLLQIFGKTGCGNRTKLAARAFIGLESL